MGKQADATKGGAAWGPSTASAATVLQMALGFANSRALCVAADLGIADHLATGPLSAEEIAKRTGTHADAVFRLLRALVSFGVLRHEDPDRFALTSAGELLRSGVPGSLRSTIRFLVGEWSWRAWEDLNHSICTSQPAFDHAWGVSNFDYWARNPHVSEIHDQAMAELTAAETTHILDAYDFSACRTIVDVGGGNGALLAAILARHHEAEGILADLPHVVAGASATLEKSSVIGRCKIVGGDFFETVPQGGEIYILKHIIHDWDERRSLTILRNCFTAMKSGAKLLVIDRVLPEVPNAEAAGGYVADLIMLVLTPGGRERTETEFQSLFDSAGFELTRLVRTAGPTAIVEGRKP